MLQAGGYVDWSEHSDVIARWRDATLAHAAAVNAHVAAGEACGWQDMPPAPTDPRDDDLATAVLGVVRRGNEAGRATELRTHLPPDLEPLVAALDQGGDRTIRQLAWMGPHRVFASVGSVDGNAGTVGLDLRGEARLLPGIGGAGSCGNWVAVVMGDEVDVRRAGARGSARRFALPGGGEAVPESSVAIHTSDHRSLATVQPLPDGSGALLTQREGIFRVDDRGLVRVFPTQEVLAATLDLWEEDGHAAITLDYRWLHAALSPEGDVLLCGAQESNHLLMDLDGTVLLDLEPPAAPFPHHASFSPDGRWLCLHAADLAEGHTVLAELAPLRTGTAPADVFAPLEGVARVHASAWLADTVILGDGDGYLRAHGLDGRPRWERHIGSVVTSLAVSADQQRLAVGTAAGVVIILRFDDAGPEPHVIGTGPLVDQLRLVLGPDDALWLW